MVAFIDAHRQEYGVEPICAQLPIAPATYHRHKVQHHDPSQRCQRQQRDAQLIVEIRRVHAEHFQVYGSKKVWEQLRRERIPAARCTVKRLMDRAGLRGVRKDATTRTTCGVEVAAGVPDLVDRHFVATQPNQLWVSDLTYIATWRGFVYAAFVIDVFARYIVGWRVSTSLHTNLPLDALEQALHDRRPAEGLIHHSDRGVQYLSMRYTQRLVDAGIAPSVGSRGDSYDNALAEAVMSLYKAELIRPRGPWRTIEDVEFATLTWVDWFNHRRLHGSIGYVPPAEYEAQYYESTRVA
jgi:putative transposase